jgi:putative tryptophan/tyrosine transport system substrate-binding protein
MSRTTRRAVLAGMAAALAPGARAQQREGVRRIGALMGVAESDASGKAAAAALVHGLDALGWKLNQTLRIEWRWTIADPTLFERYAAELVALGPDVLTTWGSSKSVETLRRHTSAIPIVFTTVADPVGQGFVASLAHPGGNITGFSNFDAPLAGKWLQMLTDISPPVAHAAVLFNPVTAPYAGLMMRAIEASAPSLRVAVRAAPCHDDTEIEAAVAGIAREERGGLLILPDAFNAGHSATILALAAQHRLPLVSPYAPMTAAGGLMSYGNDGIDQMRRAADYIDRVLKGAKAGDLPVQNPTKFQTAFNLKTAKALGVTIPSPLLLLADDIIE